jgi:hypothetical protein
MEEGAPGLMRCTALLRRTRGAYARMLLFTGLRMQAVGAVLTGETNPYYTRGYLFLL